MIWGFLLLVAKFFRISHWPGGLIMLVTFSAGLTAYAFSGFLRCKGKNWLNNLISITGLIWTAYIVIGTWYYNEILLNNRGALIYLSELVFFFLLYEFLKRFGNKKKNKRT